MQARTNGRRPGAWTLWVLAAGAVAVLAAGVRCDEALDAAALAALKSHYQWHEWGTRVRYEDKRVDEAFFNEADFSNFGNSVLMKWAGPKSRSIYILDEKGGVSGAVHIALHGSPVEAKEAALKLTITVPPVEYFRGEATQPGDVYFYAISRQTAGERRVETGGRAPFFWQGEPEMVQGALFARNNAAVRIFALPGHVEELARLVDERLLDAMGRAEEDKRPWRERVTEQLKERYNWKDWSARVREPGKRIESLAFAAGDFSGFGGEVRIHATGEGAVKSLPVYILDDVGKTKAVVYMVALSSDTEAKEDMFLATLFSGLDYRAAEEGGEWDFGDVCLCGVSEGHGQGEVDESSLRGLIFARNNVEVRINYAGGRETAALARLVDARLVALLKEDTGTAKAGSKR